MEESKLWISVVWVRKMIRLAKRRMSVFAAMTICRSWVRLLSLLQPIRDFTCPRTKKKILIEAINTVARIRSSKLLKMVLWENLTALASFMVELRI